jgi:phosphate transport system substrate-binding protein
LLIFSSVHTSKFTARKTTKQRVPIGGMFPHPFEASLMTRLCSAAILGLALVIVTGCGGTGSKDGGAGGGGGSQKLNIGGATFVYPMMDKWAFEYEKAKGVKVNYNSIGSGSGIQQMTAQTLDFGCSDAPLTDQQLEEARAKNGDVVHIPLVLGAVVPAYKLSGVEQPLVFSGPVLADIFLGKITRWNDPALKTLNPGISLPDTPPIGVVHRSEGSGTTYVFADYLAKVSPEWKSKVGVSTSIKFPVGVGAKGNEGVAGFVKENEGALGYVELIYALGQGIKYGAVLNREGSPVEGSLESVTAAAAALTQIPEDLRYSLTDAPGKASYPISGTNWAVLYVKQPEAKKKTIVDFLTWVTHDGQQYCEKLHYASLPKGLVERLEKKLERVKEGGAASRLWRIPIS